MPILELENEKEFIKEMKEILKENDKYQLIFAQNGKIVLQPTVSTSRRNILLLRDFTPDSVEEIKKAAKTFSKLKIKTVLSFFFDEKREPQDHIRPSK